LLCGGRWKSGVSTPPPPPPLTGLSYRPMQRQPTLACQSVGGDENKIHIQLLVASLPVADTAERVGGWLAGWCTA